MSLQLHKANVSDDVLSATSQTNVNDDVLSATSQTNVNDDVLSATSQSNVNDDVLSTTSQTNVKDDVLSATSQPNVNDDVLSATSQTYANNDVLSATSQPNVNDDVFSATSQTNVNDDVLSANSQTSVNDDVLSSTPSNGMLERTCNNQYDRLFLLSFQTAEICQIKPSGLSTNDAIVKLVILEKPHEPTKACTPGECLSLVYPFKKKAKNQKKGEKIVKAIKLIPIDDCKSYWYRRYHATAELLKTSNIDRCKKHYLTQTDLETQENLQIDRKEVETTKRYCYDRLFLLKQRFRNVCRMKPANLAADIDIILDSSHAPIIHELKIPCESFLKSYPWFSSVNHKRRYKSLLTPVNIEEEKSWIRPSLYVVNCLYKSFECCLHPCLIKCENNDKNDDAMKFNGNDENNENTETTKEEININGSYIEDDSLQVTHNHITMSNEIKDLNNDIKPLPCYPLVSSLVTRQQKTELSISDISNRNVNPQFIDQVLAVSNDSSSI